VNAQVRRLLMNQPLRENRRESAQIAHMRDFRAGKLDIEQLRRSAKAVIETETRSILMLLDRIDDNFLAACEQLMLCRGRVVVSGIGKSGHIARKIAATMASTGTPAFFVHPAEASHGDLGMITPDDVVLAISNSGETDELLTILPVIKRKGVPLVVMTGNESSTLARLADVHLDVSVDQEACPLGLAPTASTTVALVMGDALSIALLEARGFTSEDFAASHPAGSLGRRLLVHIGDVMHTGAELPKVLAGASVTEALMEMTRTGLGLVAIVDAHDRLLGVFTDGDLRRAVDDADVDLRTAVVQELMTAGGKTIGADKLAIEAARLMERHKINALVVVDESQQVVGALNFHDLLRARVV
jgi:arabinose-5-phosphate isomerase